MDWFNNRLLLEPIGNIPPAEAEARCHARLEKPALAARLKQPGLRQTRDGSGSMGIGISTSIPVSHPPLKDWAYFECLIVALRLKQGVKPAYRTPPKDNGVDVVAIKARQEHCANP